MQNQPMMRVSKERLCPVCGKPDWCLVNHAGTAAICARIEQGSIKRSGDAGWLHVLGTEDRSQKPVDRTGNCQLPSSNFQVQAKGPTAAVGMAADFSKLTEQYKRRCSERQVRLLAQSLGVTPASLVRLDLGWDGEAFCFPMRDENGVIIGIRRRFGNGKKVCVSGSRNGLFVPSGIENASNLVICEGPTDCAAALDMGWDAIGRPNCDCKIAMAVRYVRRRKVVIVADRDSAGLRGARKLYEALEAAGSAVRIIVPPDGCKDLRDWKRLGIRIEL